MHAVSALGATREIMDSRLSAGPVPVSAVKDFEFHQLEREYACYRPDGWEPADVLGKKGLRTKDWSTKLLMATIEAGFKQTLESFGPDNAPGLCVGTSFGSVQSIGDFLSDSIVNGVNAVNPMLFGNTVINSPTGNANIRFNIKQLSATVSTGFNSGLDTIIYAVDHIRSGHATALLAGAVEEISYYTLVALERSGVLSRKTVSQPFATDADGYVPGEGCAMFMIETESSAKARGAQILAVIAGVGSSFDPTPGAFDPAGASAKLAVEEALAMAGMKAADIGFVAASAAGQAKGDAMEAAVLASLLPSAPVAAYKARTGECYGASPALNTACALLDMQAGRISGTAAHYPVRAGVNLVTSTRVQASKATLVNAFSCDGHCGSLVLARA